MTHDLGCCKVAQTGGKNHFFFVIFVIFGWLMIIWGYQNP
jgi:hypothetical protein